MSLGSFVTRSIIAFISLVILGIAGVFTWIFSITPIGMAAGSCANGASNAVNFYTSILGIMIALGAIVPPALLLFLKRWYWALIALGIFVVMNVILATAQFWFPMSYCK